MKYPSFKMISLIRLRRKQWVLGSFSGALALISGAVEK